MQVKPDLRKELFTLLYIAVHTTGVARIFRMRRQGVHTHKVHGYFHILTTSISGQGPFAVTASILRLYRHQIK